MMDEELKPGPPSPQYTCPTCGGVLSFSQESGEYWCDHCRDLDIQSNREEVSQESDNSGKYGDLYEEEHGVASKPEIPLSPEPKTARKFFNRKYVSVLIIFLIIIVMGSILLIPPLLKSTPGSTAQSSIPAGSTIPTTITVSPTVTAQSGTDTQTLGENATVTLPYHETLKLGYNTVNRYFTSLQSPITITYDVTPNIITEQKVIPSPSGDYSKTVTYDDPNAYLLITVRDAQNGNVIRKDGYGKTYSSSHSQKMTITQTGNLNMEITGAKLSVSISVA